VHQRMEFLKDMRAAELVSLAGGLIGLLPSALQAFAGPMISQLPITPFNMVCTNVPGPQHPLYLLGRKMLTWYPYVPVGGELAVNCAILSYDGTVFFGFSGDMHAAPDLSRMEKFLKISFAELRDAVMPRRKRFPRTKKVPAKTQAATTPAATATVRESSFTTVASSVATALEPQPIAEKAKHGAQLVA